MANTMVTRLPSGITNVSAESMFADMVQSVPTIYHSYLNDFDTYVAADWVVTATGSTTQALTAGDNGLLLLTNSAANADLLALQKTPAAFLLDPVRKTFFAARFKVSDATLSSLVMGLQVVDTTPLDVTDGVYFLKSSASTAVSVISRKDATTGSTSASSVATMANDTFITLGWYYDANGKLLYMVNGTVVGSLSIASFFPDTAVTVSFAIQNGEAVAKTMTLDYIYVAKSRVDG